MANHPLACRFCGAKSTCFLDLVEHETLHVLTKGLKPKDVGSLLSVQTLIDDARRSGTKFPGQNVLTIVAVTELRCFAHAIRHNLPLLEEAIAFYVDTLAAARAKDGVPFTDGHDKEPKK